MTDLGCSLIFVQDVMSSLSENIKTVVNIKDRNTGQLVMEEGILREIDFRLDHSQKAMTRSESLGPWHRSITCRISRARSLIL